MEFPFTTIDKTRHFLNEDAIRRKPLLDILRIKNSINFDLKYFNHFKMFNYVLKNNNNYNNNVYPDFRTLKFNRFQCNLSTDKIKQNENRRFSTFTL